MSIPAFIISFFRYLTNKKNRQFYFLIYVTYYNRPKKCLQTKKCLCSVCNSYILPYCDGAIVSLAPKELPSQRSSPPCWCCPAKQGPLAGWLPSDWLPTVCQQGAVSSPSESNWRRASHCCPKEEANQSLLRRVASLRRGATTLLALQSRASKGRSLHQQGVLRKADKKA